MHFGLINVTYLHGLIIIMLIMIKDYFGTRVTSDFLLTRIVISVVNQMLSRFHFSY